jgi:HPt (histidine-containing phosphotransfer) domain-containing protein
VEKPIAQGLGEAPAGPAAAVATNVDPPFHVCSTMSIEVGGPDGRAAASGNPSAASICEARRWRIGRRGRSGSTGDFAMGERAESGARWSATGAARSEEDRRAPVDLVHLARQTFGSIELEREVLDLFVRHGDGLVDHIARPAGDRDRAEALHRLKGSARGIGAVRVAALAERLEMLDPASAETTRLIDDLARAVTEVARFVEALFPVEGRGAAAPTQEPRLGA